MDVANRAFFLLSRNILQSPAPLSLSPYRVTDTGAQASSHHVSKPHLSLCVSVVVPYYGDGDDADGELNRPRCLTILRGSARLTPLSRPVGDSTSRSGSPLLSASASAPGPGCNPTTFIPYLVGVHAFVAHLSFFSSPPFCSLLPTLSC